MHKILKEPVNGLTHLIAALVGIPGLALLLARSHGDLPKQVSLLIFGLSLILQFCASAAYHLLDLSAEKVTWLRRLDHVAIFLLIAGTYTPAAFNILSGGWRVGLLVAIWLIALVGVIFKVAYINAPRWLTVGLYLMMGWLVVIPIKLFWQLLPPGALTWLALGGAFYTVGAVIYLLKRPNFFPGVFGFHEVWHLFVIAGAASHYLLMLNYVVPYQRLM